MGAVLRSGPREPKVENRARGRKTRHAPGTGQTLQPQKRPDKLFRRNTLILYHIVPCIREIMHNCGGKNLDETGAKMMIEAEVPRAPEQLDRLLSEIRKPLLHADKRRMGDMP